MAKPKGALLELLVQCLKSSARGSRTIIIPKQFSFWNLHRVIQISFHPGMQDGTIERRTFEYKQGDVQPKKGKMIKIDTFNIEDNDQFEYVCEALEYSIKVVDSAEEGELNSFIPRCINGDGDNVDLDAINKKLLFKRFGMNPSMNKKPRQAPKIFVMANEPDYMIWKTYMARMRRPVFEENELATGSKRSHQEIDSGSNSPAAEKSSRPRSGNGVPNKSRQLETPRAIEEAPRQSEGTDLKKEAGEGANAKQYSEIPDASLGENAQVPSEQVPQHQPQQFSAPPLQDAVFHGPPADLQQSLHNLHTDLSPAAQPQPHITHSQPAAAHITQYPPHVSLTQVPMLAAAAAQYQNGSVPPYSSEMSPEAVLYQLQHHHQSLPHHYPTSDASGDITLPSAGPYVDSPLLVLPTTLSPQQQAISMGVSLVGQSHQLPTHLPIDMSMMAKGMAGVPNSELQPQPTVVDVPQKSLAMLKSHQLPTQITSGILDVPPNAS
ncbi:hypothetical protein DFS34DRAFT_631566 [Phlyctochytrium arcticum]|nr:hypothetical protein DFS34DRAFT_631566 [Phlyctochytrium arcticum]